MGKEFFDLWPAAVAQQAVLHSQYDLRDDFQVAIHQHVEGMRHDAFGGVFNRHDAIVGAVLADFGKDVGDGSLGSVAQAGAEPADGRLVGESRLGTEIRNRHGFLQRKGAGHDFAINRSQRLVGDRPLVPAANPVEYGALPVRRVNFLARFELDLANRQNVFGPLVEQLDDLAIKPVYG